MTQPTTGDTKPAWKSMTVWGTAITTVLGMLSMFGVIPKGVTDDISGMMGPLGIVVGGVLAIIGRFRAKGPLTVT